VTNTGSVRHRVGTARDYRCSAEPGTLENDIRRGTAAKLEPDLRALLAATEVIAAVGFSTDRGKPAHSVPVFAQHAGFRVIPIHPSAARIAGEHAYRLLAEVPERIDLVVVFRPAAEAAELARQAVRIGARGLWLAEGITCPTARKIATADGLAYVEDRCLRATISRLRIHGPLPSR